MFYPNSLEHQKFDVLHNNPVEAGIVKTTYGKINSYLMMGTKGTTSYRIHDQNALYFITITSVFWIDLFSRRRNKDILIESLQYCKQNKGLELYAYCIMTNHIHCICQAKEGFLLTDILRDFKRHTAKHIINSIKDEQESRREWILQLLKKAGSANPKNKEYQIWRQDNHPIELYTNQVIDQKLDYIHNNPVEPKLSYRRLKKPNYSL